jgi:light-regulated signal transduction histidine kinase (bacteriophytochrome)
MDIQDKTKKELQNELTELQSNFNYLNILKDIDDAKRMQREQELAVALQEIAFQNEEKGKRASELIIANLELKFETEEKAKRAAEFVIANIELVFQNEEKAKRAAELVIANKELVFQNGEKVKRAKELENLNKDLEQFAYVASHDLQEPLRMISSYTQLLERKYKDKLDQDANDYIHFVVDGAIRMQKLLINLLDFSRVSTHAKTFEQVDSKKIAGQAILNLQQLIRENTALITIDDLPVIQADEMQMLQVFQNLIENAIKFKKKTPGLPAGRELPKIHISYTKQNNMHQFSVTDNGLGMEMQYYDRVFIVFQRLHSTKDYPGTGIGLSICKRIVERHGGTIWFESTVNEGSTFYFTIPV